VKKIIFLHIPKTAGQTVHSELARVIGEDQTSPIRVHTQAPDDGQFPPGYTLYSGHLDWMDLGQFGTDRFAFTILRDPFERIASFYFYLLEKSQGLDVDALNAPANAGLKKIRENTADDYFFGGDAGWQQFIRDHYDNFYCSYFVTHKIRGAAQIADIPTNTLIPLAQKGAAQLDCIYSIEGLAALEQDIARLTGQQISIVEKRINPGPKLQGTKRWPQLLERIESDANKQKLADFSALDVKLMQQLHIQGALS
jgi:hypothetical protein